MSPSGAQALSLLTLPSAGCTVAARDQGPLSSCSGPRPRTRSNEGARAGAAAAGRRRRCRRRHCEGGRERASERGRSALPLVPAPPPSPPRPPPLGRAAARREEVEEAEEGAREGGSARPPAAGAAAAASAVAGRGAVEHGAGAAVPAAGIPEAGATLTAPSWKKCWLFGDRSEENRPQTDIQALWDLTLLLCGQPAPTDNVGKLSGPLENTNLISEVADCGRMCRR